MLVPNVKRSEWQAISIDSDGYVTLMDVKGNTRADLRLPNETEDDEVVAKRISDGLDAGKEVIVTVLSAMGIEKISETKEI